MKLIERYLHAVRTWLPEKHQADFLAELEDDLKSEIEDEEHRLGRALAESELAELLKRRGHPTLAATRLLPQQHLIGPAWYPIWRFALRAVIVWILAPVFVLILAPLAAFSSPRPFAAALEAILGLPFAAFYALAGITLVVAALERFQVKVSPFEKWDPLQLPSAAPLSGGAPLSRPETIVNMAGSMMFLLWWVGLIKSPASAALSVSLAPGWAAFYWPVMLLTMGSLALSTVQLLSPYWRPAFSVAGLILSLSTLATLGLLLRIDPAVIVTAPAGNVEQLRQLISWGVQTILALGIVSCAILIFIDVRRLASSGKRKLNAIAPARPSMAGTDSQARQ